MTHNDDSPGRNLALKLQQRIQKQIILNIGPTLPDKVEIVISKYHRHTITEPNFTTDKLIILLKSLNQSVLNDTKTSDHFAKYRVKFTKIQVGDDVSEEKQQTIII